MRAFGKMFALASLALAAASMAVGQPPFQPGGFFGKGKGGDYFTLLQNGQIKDELKITNQQVEKLPAAALKALSEVLDQQQVKRLREIFLQLRGNSVFLEADVKKELKITDDQAKKIQAALNNQVKEQQAMFEGGNFDFEKMQELQKTATDTVQGVLTQDQKTAWTKMTGTPFEMKGGFGKKK
jgi:Spy/CpxP family protein refolding chaperone